MQLYCVLSLQYHHVVILMIAHYLSLLSSVPVLCVTISTLFTYRWTNAFFASLVHKPAVNILHMFLYEYMLSLGEIPRSRTAEFFCRFIFKCLGICQMVFPKWLYLFTFPAGVYERFSYSPSLSKPFMIILWILVLLGVQSYSIVVLNLFFSGNDVEQTSLYIFAICTSLVKCLLNTVPIFLNQLFAFLIFEF